RISATSWNGLTSAFRIPVKTSPPKRSRGADSSRRSFAGSTTPRREGAGRLTLASGRLKEDSAERRDAPPPPSSAPTRKPSSRSCRGRRARSEHRRGGNWLCDLLSAGPLSPRNRDFPEGPLL